MFVQGLKRNCARTRCIPVLLYRPTMLRMRSESKAGMCACNGAYLTSLVEKRDSRETPMREAVTRSGRLVTDHRNLGLKRPRQVRSNSSLPRHTGPCHSSATSFFKLATTPNPPIPPIPSPLYNWPPHSTSTHSIYRPKRQESLANNLDEGGDGKWLQS